MLIPLGLLCPAIPSLRCFIEWVVAPNLIPILVVRSDAENFAGRLALIESSLLKRPVKFYSALGSTRTLIHTTAAVPAFIGMQGNRGLALFGIWYVYIHLTYIDTCIAAIADFRIPNDGFVRRCHVGNNIYLVFLFFSSLEDFTGAFEGNRSAGYGACLEEISALYCHVYLRLFHDRSSMNSRSLGAVDY
jgi:hypothetical protein